MSARVIVCVRVCPRIVRVCVARECVLVCVCVRACVCGCACVCGLRAKCGNCAGCMCVREYAREHKLRVCV